MDEFEPPNPPLKPEDEAIIRDMMAKKAISFAEAHQEWENMKTKSNQEKLEKQAKLKDPERKNDNG